MDGWEVALLVAAGYIGATALVRLMIRRRDQVLGEFRRKMAQEKRRKRAEQDESRSGHERAA